MTMISAAPPLRRPPFPLTAMLAVLAVVVPCLHLLRTAVRPIQYDATEFLRVGWMMAQGKQPFIDFFQNHSPFYLMMLGHFYDPTAINYPLWVMLSHQGALVVAAWFFAVAMIRAAGMDRHPWRWPMALAVFIVFSALSPIMREHPIRPETPATLCLAIAWAGACRRGWTMALLTMTGLGLAVLFSPRALAVAVVILIWGLWHDWSRQRLRQYLIGGVAGGAALLAALALIVPLDTFYHWVVVFNRYLPEAHRMPYWRHFPGGDGVMRVSLSYGAILKDGAFLTAFLSFLISVARSRAWTAGTVCALLAPALALPWLFADRSWAQYSFDFLYMAATVPFCAGLLWLVRAWADGRRRAGGAVMAAMLAATAVASPVGFYSREVFASRDELVEYMTGLRDEILHPTTTRQVVLFSDNDSAARLRYHRPLDWLRRMRRMCAALPGESAFIPELPPYCLDSPSYHWIAWRQLENPALRQLPWYVVSDYAADFARARPAIIHVPEWPPLLAPEVLAAVPMASYHRLGDYFIRNDLTVPVILGR